MVDSLNMLLWHYTTSARIQKIVEDAAIKPATAFVEPNERPIVWFTTNQRWENTVSKSLLLPNGKMIGMDMVDMMARGIKLYRIGVLPKSAPFDWPTLLARSSVSV